MAIPADNPFAERRLRGRPEIWDWGMRNPWRFSFDRESGALFIGDVGQDKWEEIDVEPAGAGRPQLRLERHGRQRTATRLRRATRPALTLPVAEYSHADGCTVIGGYVYRGTRFPAFVGRYFYADLCRGTSGPSTRTPHSRARP